MTKKKAFTLIELLVVIAIISLLVSILLPSLNKAKDLAKQVVCLSNMKQLGLSFALYQQDYDGWFPPAMRLDDEPYWGYAAILINGGYTGTKTGGVFMCPSHENDITKYWMEMDMTAATGSTVLYHPDYGYNCCHIGGSWRYSESNKTPTQLSRIKEPTETILLADVYYTGVYYGDNTKGWFTLFDFFLPYGLGNYGCLDARHNDAVNVLWVDGHASGCPVGVTGTRDSYTEIDNPYNFAPFENGFTVGDNANHFDRE